MRSALNTIIRSSKRTTMVSSSSPPLGHHIPSHPVPLIFKQLRRRVRVSLTWANLQGAVMAGWWKARGQLCCPLGLSPCWALIKSRPWCEAFCWGSSGLLSPLSLDVSQSKRRLLSACYLSTEFIVILQFPQRTIFPSSITDVPHLHRISMFLLLSCWISSISLLLEFCEGDENHKKYSYVKGMVWKLLILLGCGNRHTPDLVRKFSALLRLQDF